ncbi:E3 ubiquitin ligase BIG BROTHER-related [Ricinus communis]|uniref:RING-type domain-containing protein n=1 Tax=Ricinus communis TaxID=3988 RepID=B9T4Z4_RICCO|nr:E3 ubiquitin ligase BIG BROTHER-related [Ricinus communis]EEF29070.1 conserved hypothetical protein [Ricinus communis]|eukprot:XP_002533313.1 E3 ubiquitin ligase BIG BROTHER-related [Ricinus communis]
MSRTVNLILGTKPSTTQEQENPVFCLELRFHYKYKRLFRNPEGQVREAQSYSAPPSSALFQLQPSALSHSFTCHAQIHELLSSLNVDHELRLFLAPEIATFLMSLSRPGFHAVADIEVVHEEFLDAQEPLPMMMMLDGVMMMDGEDVNEPRRGVSRSTLEKLKKERFSAAAAEAGGISDDCAICLEEFGGEVKLIKMPCAHIFHENCIFRWLKNQKTCPTCRREVDN